VILLLAGFLFVIAAPLQSVSAKTKTLTEKPGWGYGDTNHIHTGPPGQSVRPGTVITQTNNTNVSNSVNVSGNTGGNKSNGNAGGLVRIVTGAVSNAISIVVTAGTNIIHSL
jgi:hypothetical protein